MGTHRNRTQLFEDNHRPYQRSNPVGPIFPLKYSWAASTAQIQLGRPKSHHRPRVYAGDLDIPPLNMESTNHVLDGSKTTTAMARIV